MTSELITQTGDILATGFVADTPDVSSGYPAAGNNSANPNFQAIYWRCIAVFLFSAAVNAREYRRVVFSNIEPPVVDGFDLKHAFDRMGAGYTVLPLRHRLPNARQWGNVFYFLDIMHHLPADCRFALFDSDVVLVDSVKPLMTQIRDTGLVGYGVDTAVDENVNGLSMRDAARIAEHLSGQPQPEMVKHFGGEMLGVDMNIRSDALSTFDELWRQMQDAGNQPAAILTEEHFWSVAFAAYGWPIELANDHMKRIWTARNFRTVMPGDEDLAVWHLPAEKRYGFLDMFRWIAARNFDTAVDPSEFRAVAKRCFGIPQASGIKRIRDFQRGVRHKLSRN